MGVKFRLSAFRRENSETDASVDIGAAQLLSFFSILPGP